MKIKKLSANSFGCFKDWESPGIDGDIVVVYGSNESGKTTLFKLVSTLLYGWNPVSDNPYVPWEQSYAACSGLIGYGTDNEEMIIERKLRSRPEGAAYINGTKYELKNNEIPYLKHMPRDIFNEVYMLSGDSLRFPGQKAWAGLQDMLLGGEFSSIINPLNEVAAALDEKATSLWRPDRKGNPEYKRLVDMQKSLRDRLKRALENDEALHGLENKMEDIKKEIEKLSLQKLEMVKLLDRHDRLYPVYKKLNKIKELEALAGDLSGVEQLSGDPEGEINSIRVKITELTEESLRIKSRIGGLEDVKSRYTATDMAVISYKDNIESLVRSAGQAEGDMDTLSDLDMEIEKLKARLADRAEGILTGGWQDGLEDMLHDIDDAQIRHSIQSYRACDAKFRDQEAGLTGLKAGYRKAPGIYLMLPLILMLSGGAGLLFSGSLQNGQSNGGFTPMGIFSLIICALGLCLFIFYLSSRKGSSAQMLKEAEQRYYRAAEDRKSAIEYVKKSLQGLPIAEGRLDDPGESLLVDVGMLKDMVYKINDILERKNIVMKRLREVSRAVYDVMKGCSLKPSGSMMDCIYYLEAELKGTEGRRLQHSGASERLEEERGKLDKIEQEIKKSEETKSSILSILDMVDGDNLHQRCEELKRRRKLKSTASALKEELDHDYPDLDEIVSSIERLDAQGRGWILDEDSISAIRIRREDTDNSLMELNKRLGSIKNELDIRQQGERPDDIKGRIQGIEAEKEDAAAKRDRIMLLKNILLEADRKYREENQPDVLLKAGRYISTITGGRYTKIYADGEDGGLQVKGDYTPDILDVEKRMLSRGTRGQVYLSLRLGLMDHLDRGGERLPLFLDEALVDWDDIRISRTLELLKSISQNRQIFIFTCKYYILELLKGDGISHICLG